MSASGRILYVEDEAVIALSARAILEGAGYEVRIAPDGAAGLALARAERFDLVIADHMMPVMTGLEMIAALRAAGDAVPVLLATSIAADLLPDGAGHDGYLGKPYGAAELLAAVARLVADGRGRG